MGAMEGIGKEGGQCGIPLSANPGCVVSAFPLQDGRSAVDSIFHVKNRQAI